MSHRGGPDHADVTSSWFGSLALLVLLCRVWRMDPLGFSGRGPGCTFPPLHSGWGAGPPAPILVGVRGPPPPSIGGGGPHIPSAATGAETAVKGEASGCGVAAKTVRRRLSGRRLSRGCGGAGGVLPLGPEPAGGGCTARRLPHPQPRPAPRSDGRPRPLTQAPLTRALPIPGEHGRNEPGSRQASAH